MSIKLFSAALSGSALKSFEQGVSSKSKEGDPRLSGLFAGRWKMDVLLNSYGWHSATLAGKAEPHLI